MDTNLISNSEGELNKEFVIDSPMGKMNITIIDEKEEAIIVKSIDSLHAKEKDLIETKKTAIFFTDANNNIIENHELQSIVKDIIESNITETEKASKIQVLSEKNNVGIVFSKDKEISTNNISNNIKNAPNQRLDRAIIRDLNQNLINDLDIINQVLEILDQDTPREKKSEMLTKISTNNKVEIVITDKKYLQN